jgi:hypothetical protein
MNVFFMQTTIIFHLFVHTVSSNSQMAFGICERDMSRLKSDQTLCWQAGSLPSGYDASVFPQSHWDIPPTTSCGVVSKQAALYNTLIRFR